MTEKAESKKLQLTYVKSAIGYSKRHKETIRALGFRRLNQTVVKEDNPSIRGMLLNVSHLVKIVELVD